MLSVVGSLPRDATQAPHLWDSLGARHRSTLPETLLPSQGWAEVQHGGAQGLLQQKESRTLEPAGCQSLPRPRSRHHFDLPWHRKQQLEAKGRFQTDPVYQEWM